MNNTGGNPTDGSQITFTDTLPAGLTATALGGSGWNCTLATLTCTTNSVIQPAAPLTLTLTFNLAANAAASVTNTVSISGGNSSPAQSSAATSVVQFPDVTVACQQNGTFSAGEIGATYTLTVTNSGMVASGGAIILGDILPVGLTATAMAGAGNSKWRCTVASLSCTRADSLAASRSTTRSPSRSTWLTTSPAP